jgi:hypothetical protein
VVPAHGRQIRHSGGQLLNNAISSAQDFGSRMFHKLPEPLQQGAENYHKYVHEPLENTSDAFGGAFAELLAPATRKKLYSALCSTAR